MNIICNIDIFEYITSHINIIDYDYIKHVKSMYEKKRDITLSILKNIPNISYSVPKGAFYIIVTIPGVDTEHFAEWLLTSFSYDGKTVLVAPLRDFYINKKLGLDQIRLAYVLEDNALFEALKIFEKGVSTYLNQYPQLT